MAGVHFSDRGLVQLQDLKQLKAFSLFSESGGITDAGLATLRTLPALESLDLSNTQITDRGLESLRDFNNLKEVDFHGSKVSPEGWAQLQTKRPHLKRLR